MAYDSTDDTNAHIGAVRENLTRFAGDLHTRGIEHDKSKLEAPEKEAYDKITPALKGVTYGSDEYRATLKEMKPAIQHHYSVNSHHPEHYENGLDGMTLADIVEMLCDWQAASRRHADGDIRKSIQINRDRFGMSDQLAQILLNSLDELGWV